MYDVLRSGVATAVFIDSSAIVAYFNRTDVHGDEARAFFRGVRNGELRARPLYTSEYVVDEAATTLLARAGHGRAAQAVEFLRGSSQVHLLHVEPSVYDSACERFVDYDDQSLSFTDHVIGTQARENAVEHVLSFDQDFEVIGLTTLP